MCKHRKVLSLPVLIGREAYLYFVFLLLSKKYRLGYDSVFIGNRQFAGVYSGGVTPDPIPNSEVKPASGECSAEEAQCKNSTMPPFIFPMTLVDAVELDEVHCVFIFKIS